MSEQNTLPPTQPLEHSSVAHPDSAPVGYYQPFQIGQPTGAPTAQAPSYGVNAPPLRDSAQAGTEIANGTPPQPFSSVLQPPQLPPQLDRPIPLTSLPPGPSDSYIPPVTETGNVVT